MLPFFFFPQPFKDVETTLTLETDSKLDLTPGLASLVAQLVKNLPAMQETRVWFLAWEDPLEKEMATHFSILAWRIP